MVWSDLLRDTHAHAVRAQAAHAPHDVRDRLGHRVDHADGGGRRGPARRPGQGGRELRQGHDDRLRRPHQPAGRRHARRPPACSGRRPTTWRSQKRGALLRLRDAGARADGAPSAAPTTAARSRHRARCPTSREIRSIPVAEGRYPNWDDERQVRRVAFLGSDAKKQLFGNRPAMGETIRIGDFPYTVIGVDGAQGAGLELRRPRHRQGLRAVQRDPAGLPEQAAGARRTRWTGCS